MLQEKSVQLKIEEFIHDSENYQFILFFEGEKAFVNYHLSDGKYYLTHAEVPISMRGKGIGKQLVEKTFQYVEDHQLKAKAICSYIRLIRQRDTKWHDIIS